MLPNTGKAFPLPITFLLSMKFQTLEQKHRKPAGTHPGFPLSEYIFYTIITANVEPGTDTRALRTPTPATNWSSYRVPVTVLSTVVTSFHPPYSPGGRRCYSSHFIEMRNPKFRESQGPPQDHKSSNCEYQPSSPTLSTSKQFFNWCTFGALVN